MLDILAAKLLAEVSRESVTFSGIVHAKFSNPESPFQATSVDLKLTNKAHARAIEDSAVNLNSLTVSMDAIGMKVSKTSVHMDGGLSEKEALNNQGVYENVGCMKGTRWLFGWGEWGQRKEFAFYDRFIPRYASKITQEAARIGKVYQFKNCWIYCFNGPIRHYVPQANRITKFHHRGSSVGGACFMFIMTMTSDVNQVEAKWIVKQILTFMSKLEALFEDVL